MEENVMRKLFVFFALLFGLVSLASCGGSSVADGKYTGYVEEATQWATYSAKVEVEVKDGKIESVVVLNDECHIYTDASSWTESALWTDHVQELLDSYKGLSVSDIVNAETSPVDALAGATQSSDRLFKAVKEALSK